MRRWISRRRNPPLLLPRRETVVGYAVRTARCAVSGLTHLQDRPDEALIFAGCREAVAQVSLRQQEEQRALAVIFG